MSMSAPVEPRIVQRPLGGAKAELGHNREIVVVARRNARRHAVGIEDAVQRVNMTCHHAGRMGDKGRVRFRQQRLAAAGAPRILQVDIGIEAVDQFLVGDGGFRDQNADPADA